MTSYPPIRVAMIIQAYHPLVGGAERQLASLAPLLQAHNVEISVLTRRYRGLAPFETVDGVPVYRLPIWGPKPAASLLFSLAALFHLRRLQPHVIHAHELLSPTTTAVLAKRLWGTPVAAKVLRGGRLGDVAKLKARPTGLRRLHLMRRHVDAFITISTEINRELAALDVPAWQRPFIPNGVDTARFSPPAPGKKTLIRRQLGLPPQTAVVVFTGRLAAEKRVDQLLAIWPQVRQAHIDARLLILGAGEEEAALRRQAGRGVHFAGRVADVAPYLRAADLFVLPSATEGLSNALLEAMATGVAVAATAVGGAPDLIDDGGNGWLMPPDDPQALQETIITALANPAQREQMGALARLHVQRDYSLETTALRLRRLYDTLLPAPQKARSAGQLVS